MQETTTDCLKKLVENLEDQFKFYTELQMIILAEGEELVGANLEKINELNRSKQALLFRLRKLEDVRLRIVKEVAAALEHKSSVMSISEISRLVDEPFKGQLLELQKNLLRLIEQLKIQNAENTMVTEAALKNLNGAINEIKDTLAGRPTYQRKGSINRGPEKAGHLVRREA